METPDGTFRFEIIAADDYHDDPVGKEITDETVLGVFHLSENGSSWVLDSFLTVEVLARRFLGGPMCRACGCMDLDACVDDDLVPCWWVAVDLCSHCVKNLIVAMATGGQEG